MTTCCLALEDGVYYKGNSFGAQGEVTAEIIFNTGMTGYQEILTDPSHKGQMVIMTYPEIGNYGVNDEDIQSAAQAVAEGIAELRSEKFTVLSLQEYHKNT